MLGDLGKKREEKEVSGIKDIIPVFPFPDFCKWELEHSVREFNTEVKGCTWVRTHYVIAHIQILHGSSRAKRTEIFFFVF